MSIEIVRVDLTTLAVDAVVNAAAPDLLGGGGVDGAIHRAAGPQLLAACRALPALSSGVRRPPGEARLTAGFALPARYVIHTVGPVWHGGDRGEPALLASCYRRCIQLAQQHALRSLAFPAISCGVYGYPVDAAAQIALSTLRAALGALARPPAVLLCSVNDEVERALRQAFSAA
jgi:O-acetyl-ADP-ribose deacetylase (regulator of RNase III)